MVGERPNSADSTITTTAVVFSSIFSGRDKIPFALANGDQMESVLIPLLSYFISTIRGVVESYWKNGDECPEGKHQRRVAQFAAKSFNEFSHSFNHNFKFDLAPDMLHILAVNEHVTLAADHVQYATVVPGRAAHRICFFIL